MNQDCVFCKIISGQIPSKIIEETDDIIVIKDIQPKALVHYLIIPKKHIANIQSCTQQDQALFGSMLLMAQKLSASLAGSQEFKLISNNGASVGQSVFHIHMHFLSGSSFQKYEV
ncbi:MAG: HIT domain-containing protein [Candidatus Dependentiae bacterium]|nr:HIT domain-containing protein [Candidatus Dependentiae bacterium]